MNKPIEPQKRPALQQGLANKKIYLIGGILILTPLVIPWVFRLFYFYMWPVAENESEPTWFETSGQFGDMFGMATCMAALIAAYFTYQTYQTQKIELQEERRRTEGADRERHFFILYDQFYKELLQDRHRLVDSNSDKDNLDCRKIINLVHGIVSSIREPANTDTTEDRRKWVKVFIEKLQESMLLKFTYIKSFRKFEIMFGYLCGQIAEFPEWSRRLFYDIVFSSLTEYEAKAFTAAYIVRDRGNPEHPLADRRALNFFTLYVRYMTSWQIENPVELLNAMGDGKELVNQFTVLGRQIEPV